MNVIKLSEHLAQNPELTLQVLHDLGYADARYNPSKNNIRFSRAGGSNATAVSMSSQTLFYTCFSTNERGSLFTLVMQRRGIGFAAALDYVCRTTGLQKQQYSQPVRYPFGGFYRSLIRQLQEPETSMPTYPDTILEAYNTANSLLFIRDGIDAQTQEFFGVGYDLYSNRITVPQYTLDGKLCGIMGRLNATNCPHEERWLPLVPCARSLTLYGYHHNYKTIVQKQTVIIMESDKAVMQAHSFGSGVVLSTGGCHISQTQAKHIKALLPKRIILGYDEGLSEQHLRAECSKLVVNNSILQNKVGYIWDADGDILAHGSKANAADMGREGFSELLKTKVRWLDAVQNA